MLPSVIP